MRMKKKLCIHIIITFLLFTVCVLSSAVAESFETTTQNSDPARITYYGANIGQFPPKIRNWIIEQGFPKEKMEKAGMKDSKLKAWWNDDGNAVLFEASYTIAKGYKGAGKRKTWGSGARYSGPNLEKYGKYKRYRTLKFRYALKREVENLVKNDPAYAEVIGFAKKLSSEIEYNWAEYDGYKDAKPIKTPGMKYAVCAGYSNEVMEKALTLKLVASVEEWGSANHSWNVLNLVDGRKLYFDLTWFDNEHINRETGIIYQTDDYDWENITFNEEIFKYSNVSYSGSYSHVNGSFKRVLKK